MVKTQKCNMSEVCLVIAFPRFLKLHVIFCNGSLNMQTLAGSFLTLNILQQSYSSGKIHLEDSESKRGPMTLALHGFDRVYLWGCCDFGCVFVFQLSSLCVICALLLKELIFEFYLLDMSKCPCAVFVSFRVKAGVRHWLVHPAGIISLRTAHCIHTFVFAIDWVPWP